MFLNSVLTTLVLVTAPMAFAGEKASFDEFKTNMESVLSGTDLLETELIEDISAIKSDGMQFYQTSGVEVLDLLTEEVLTLPVEWLSTIERLRLNEYLGQFFLYVVAVKDVAPSSDNYYQAKLIIMYPTSLDSSKDVFAVKVQWLEEKYSKEL